MFRRSQYALTSVTNLTCIGTQGFLVFVGTTTLLTMKLMMSQSVKVIYHTMLIQSPRQALPTDVAATGND
jgi:hypothetical protein